MAIPYRIANGDFSPTAKFNSHQYFRLYGITDTSFVQCTVAVSAYAHQAKETVQIHQIPFSSSGLGAGDETNKIGFSLMRMG